MSESSRSARGSTPYRPTSVDIERAKLLPASACPRRYCWWWRSLQFEWDIAPIAGCTFSDSGKPADWSEGDEPCVRSHPTSKSDHFEPREPHMIEDGLLPAWFLRLND